MINFTGHLQMVQYGKISVISTTQEMATLRRYLENKVDCHRYMLLHYFDPAPAGWYSAKM